MTRCILTVTLLVVPICARPQAFAADSTRHLHISFSFGEGHIASFDNVGSPLPYAGGIAPIAGSIEYLTPTYRHLIALSGILSFANGSPMKEAVTDYGDRRIQYGFLDLRYRYTRYYRDVGPITLLLGGEWDNALFARVYDYYGNLTFTSGSGELTSSIDAAADLTYCAGEVHRLRASLSLPLVSGVWRPAYGFENGNNSFFGRS